LQISPYEVELPTFTNSAVHSFNTYRSRPSRWLFLWYTGSGQQPCLSILVCTR